MINTKLLKKLSTLSDEELKQAFQEIQSYLVDYEPFPHNSVVEKYFGYMFDGDDDDYYDIDDEPSSRFRYYDMLCETFLFEMARRFSQPS